MLDIFKLAEEMKHALPVVDKSNGIVDIIPAVEEGVVRLRWTWFKRLGGPAKSYSVIISREDKRDISGLMTTVNDVMKNM